MIIGELIQRIQSLYSKGVQSDDARLSSRHIYNKIKTVRTRLLSQDRMKLKKLSPWDQNTLRCVELEAIPAYECPCILPSSCKTVLRSKYKLPTIIGSMISSINSIENSVKIDLINKNSARYIGANKYTGNKVNSFLEDGYLYVIKETSLGVLSLRGVFEDPIEVEAFNSYCEGCDTCGCESYLDKEFTLDSGKTETLIESSVSELVEYFRSTLEDQTSNSKDSLTTQSK